MKWFRNGFLIIGLVAGIIILFLPAPVGLSIQGIKALGVSAVCLTLWVTTPIPLAATGLLAIVLLPLVGVLDGPRVFSFFGNSAVFFLLGVFILSGAIIRTGLSKRITLIFLRVFDHSPTTVILGITLTSSFFSLLMPEHAVAAMMFPVVLQIVKSLNLKPGQSTFGKAAFLAMAWGAVVGGTGTYLGGARAPLAAELLKEAYDKDITFVVWAAAAIPVSIIITLVAYATILKFFPSEISDVTSATRYLDSEIKRIGKVTIGELKVSILAVVTIFLWIFAGQYFGLALISIAAAIMVFVLGIAAWNEISDYVNWGVIVMYGGAIALGKALAETNAVEWLAQKILPTESVSTLLFIVLFSGLSKVMTELISNVAAVVILVPLGFGFVASSGVLPEVFVLAVTVPAGLAFCLPVGTPPNAIAYSSGYYSVRDTLYAGLILNIISWIIFLLVVKFYWPCLGLGL